MKKKIAMVSGLGHDIWGRYSPDVLDREDRGTVGGGEAAMLQVSFGMARLGHEVVVYYPGKNSKYKDVTFLGLSENSPLQLLSEKFDAVVAWSDTEVLRYVPDSALRIFSQQLNSMPKDPHFWANMDTLVSPAYGHLQYLSCGAPLWWKGKMHVVSSGFTQALYAEQKPLSKRKPIVSYWSSPDRGLHHLLLMWPKILKAVPEAELRIFYHPDRIRKSTRHLWSLGEIAWRGKMLDQLIETRDRSVKIFGPIPRITLAKHQVETKVWAFPFDPIFYTEGFCAAMGEAISAGCYLVVRPADALEEVYGDAPQWVRSAVCDQAWRDRFAGEIIAGLRSDSVPNHEARDEVIRIYTWDNASKQLENALA